MPNLGNVTLGPQVQQLLAVGVPLAAIGLTLGVVYPTWGRLQTVRLRVAQQQAELRELRAAPLPPRDPVLPAADDVPSEPSLFIGTIAQMAASHQCDLISLVVQGEETPKGSELIRPVRTRITVRGRYVQIRSLISQLKRSPRLYVLTDLDVNSTFGSGRPTYGRGNLTAAMTLERYVTPPMTLTASAAP